MKRIPFLGTTALALGCFVTSLAAQSPPASSEGPADLHLLGCLEEQAGQDAQARDFFEQAAQNWPAARFNLGVMLVQGRGGDPQRDRGQRIIDTVWHESQLPQAGAWLLETALARREVPAAQAIAATLEPLANPRADLVLARMYFAQGRHERAFMLTTRAAHAGQPRAQRLLALLSRNNTGMPRDAAESASWQLIAEVVLNRPLPTDSVFYAAVKNTLQANEWIGGQPVPRETALACELPSASPAPTREPAQVAVARSVVTPVAAAAAAGSPAGMAVPTPVPASSPPEPSSPVFRVEAGQSIRDAWLAYGRLAGVQTLWSGPDAAMRVEAEVRPESVEALGGLIVESARAVGLRLKLQIQQDPAGAVQAVRIVPN